MKTLIDPQTDLNKTGRWLCHWTSKCCVATETSPVNANILQGVAFLITSWSQHTLFLIIRKEPFLRHVTITSMLEKSSARFFSVTLHPRSVCLPWTVELCFQLICSASWPCQMICHCPTMSGTHLFSRLTLSDDLRLSQNQPYYPGRSILSNALEPCLGPSCWVQFLFKGVSYSQHVVGTKMTIGFVVPLWCMTSANNHSIAISILHGEWLDVADSTE